MALFPAFAGAAEPGEPPTGSSEGSRKGKVLGEPSFPPQQPSAARPSGSPSASTRLPTEPSAPCRPFRAPCRARSGRQPARRGAGARAVSPLGPGTPVAAVCVPPPLAAWEPGRGVGLPGQPRRRERSVRAV